MTTWKFPASDLTFGWDDCHRCFYLKHALGIRRPRTPFPSVFNVIDGLMKKYYENRRTEEVLPFLRPGVVKFADNWLQSKPREVRGSVVVLTGRLDCVVAFDDGTYALIDYKTAKVKDIYVDFYSRQLHAYAQCLESPAPGRFGLAPVTDLGLVVVEHKVMVPDPFGFNVAVSWIPCPRNDEGFNVFLDEVVAVLENPVPPAPNPDCGYCTYRNSARQMTA